MSSIGSSNIVFRTSGRLSTPAIAAAIMLACPLAAQDDTGATDGENRIDILASYDDLYGPPPPMEDCSEEQEAAIISGEIIVCRRKQDQRQFRTLDRESAQDRYAKETMYRDAPPTPDPCGPNCGIFHGEPTVGGMCIPGLQKCPPPPAIFIDVEALPEAPPGSDADRIARGLPPLGNEGSGKAAPSASRQDALGLPGAGNSDAGATASVASGASAEGVSPGAAEEPGVEP